MKGQHMLRPRPTFLLLVALCAAACGGGSPADGATAAAGATSPPGGGGGAAGEPYDEAIVAAAVDKLAATGSYVYEATITQTGGSGTRIQNVRGVVRTDPALARSVSYEADGDTIVLLFADGKDWADYGNGFEEVGADAGTRDDTDPLAIATLFAGSFAGHADDFVIAATETTHDVASVHLVLAEATLADRRESLGEGAEAWVAELWLAEADGRLVKAVWGGAQAPEPDAFGLPTFTIDITDVDCTCPVEAPG
jgi:hypothetical protein